MSTNKMATIQSLLDLADHPNTPPHEADNARSKAEAMMHKYRIEEEELRQNRMAHGAGDVEQPVDRFVTVCATTNPWRDHYYTLAYYVANHVGVRTMGAYRYEETEQGRERVVSLHVIGFESDVAYVEMLLTGIRLTFSSLLEPKVDRSLSDADNVYRLRSSGMERIRIAEVMWGNGSHANNARVTKLYNAACAARGEDPKVVGRNVNAKTFRQTYADAFVTRIWSRLAAAKRDAGQESGALVLVGRKDAVDEAFYKLYPELRPKAELDGDGLDYSTCAKCTKAKSGRCRDHTYRSAKPKPYSALGASAGRKAADAADISGGRGFSRTERLEG